MDKDQLTKRLDFLWKSGQIEKKSVPFIKTAINRPVWAAWNFFFRPAISSLDFNGVRLGLSFLRFRFKEDVMAFLNEYFPGLIMFPYFSAAWSVQDDIEKNDAQDAAWHAGFLDTLQLHAQQRG